MYRSFVEACRLVAGVRHIYCLLAISKMLLVSREFLPQVPFFYSVTCVSALGSTVTLGDADPTSCGSPSSLADCSPSGLGNGTSV